jgi:hypothetical protein
MEIEALRQIGEGGEGDIDLPFFDLGYLAIIEAATVADLAQAKAFILPDAGDPYAEFLF